MGVVHAPFMSQRVQHHDACVALLLCGHRLDVVEAESRVTQWLPAVRRAGAIGLLAWPEVQQSNPVSHDELGEQDVPRAWARCMQPPPVSQPKDGQHCQLDLGGTAGNGRGK